MPGDEARVMRFLDEEAGIPAQDVRTEQVLDGIEYLGMPDHVVDPGEEHMAAMAHLALDRASARGFIVLEPAAKIGHFARAQRVNREVKAAVAIGSDVIFAQQLWHGVPQSSHLCNARSESWVRLALQFSSVKKPAGAALQHRSFARSALPVQSGDGEVRQTFQSSPSLPDFLMKTRASNLMIGSTTLAVIAAAFVGFLGFQKIHGIRQQTPLRIVFEGSASGLRKGGGVNFDGIQIGQIKSLKLDNPRKVVALAMVDNSAPIRKDTVVGLEFQGLTGIAAISLVGGAPAAPPVPLDEDGIPILTADLSEIESIRDTLHNVDRILFDNRAMLRDALLSFETYTASLASRGGALDSIMGKADGAFENFDSAMTKIDSVLPGLAHGSAEELYDKVRSIRELADSFNKRSGAFMEEGRRSLLDISQSAIKVTRKLDPQAVSGDNPPAPRPPRQKRQ